MKDQSDFNYVGSELDLFRDAKNWRRHWSKQVKPFLGPKVLEVGAGNGTVTRTLLSRESHLWVALEPDSDLSDEIRAWNVSESIENLKIVTGSLDEETLSDPSARYGCFDTIIYIDVLEHIENDKHELEVASSLLNRDGSLIVLVPAHMFLFSPFDDSLGHYRRYNRKSLEGAAPAGLQIVMRKYLDSAGMLLSLANRAILRSDMPSPLQIRIWDRFVVRLSMAMDALFRYRVGKSLVIAWRKDPVPAAHDDAPQAPLEAA